MNQDTKDVLESSVAILGIVIGFMLLFASCGGAIGLFIRAFKFFAG